MKQFFLISATLSFVLFVQSLSAQNPSKVVKGGICNGMALSIPKPEIPRSVVDANGEGIFGIVNVQILIDEKGNVEKARAVTGHPLMRPIAEKSAVNAKFKINLHLPPAKINCVLIYNFSAYDPKKSKTIKEEKKTVISEPSSDKNLILGLPVNLPKPPLPYL